MKAQSPKPERILEAIELGGACALFAGAWLIGGLGWGLLTLGAVLLGFTVVGRLRSKPP